LIGAVLFIARSLSNDMNIIIGMLANTVVSPSLPVSNGLVFCISVVFLNIFMVVTTPAHWVRIWIFGPDRLNSTQINSTVGTAFLWLLLIIVGATAATILRSTGTSDVGAEQAVIKLLEVLASYSYILVFVFWIVGVAALFSTSDSQLFSLMLLINYSPKDNSLNDRMKLQYPCAYAFIITAIFTFLYFIVATNQIPLDKLVLSVLPACLTIVPALIYLIYHRPASLAVMIISVSLYIITVIIGFLADEGEYIYTLGAPISSLLLAAFVWIKLKLNNKNIGYFGRESQT
jgi:hypothetical protein